MLQPSGWTEEREQTARQMWADGYSASLISGQIGGGISRNAILGKVHREGWVRGGAPAMGWTDERKRQVAALARQMYKVETIAAKVGGGLTPAEIEEMIVRLRAQPVVVRRVLPTVAADRASVRRRPATDPQPSLPRRNQAIKDRWTTPPVGRPECEPVTLLELQHNQCRWPLGDPRDFDTFRYCGAPKPVEEASYCPHHARMAYQPSAGKPVKGADATRSANSLDRIARFGGARL